jgi:hypothetical protein
MVQVRAAPSVGRRIDMDTETTITLSCARKDGRRERTKISDQTMPEARKLAEWLLYTGNGYIPVVHANNLQTVHRTVIPRSDGS